MKANYDQSLRRMLAHEGGYTNHPSDPGGPTNFGITIEDYHKYIDQHGTSNDVKHMTVEQAMPIYRARYWDALNCDLLPSGVDYAVFDYGVNSGIGRAARIYSQVKRADAKETINAICDERIRFLRQLKTWPVFGDGWSRRVGEVRTYALSIADKSPAPVPVPLPPDVEPIPAPVQPAWLRLIVSILEAIFKRKI
jgi:lysozyme family protein